LDFLVLSDCAAVRPAAPRSCVGAAAERIRHRRWRRRTGSTSRSVPPGRRRF